MPPTYANGHISATGDPIYFMFGSRVGVTNYRKGPQWTATEADCSAGNSNGPV